MSKRGENNLVAKHSRKFNLSHVFHDRTKFKRKPKHSKKAIDSEKES